MVGKKRKKFAKRVKPVQTSESLQEKLGLAEPAVAVKLRKCVDCGEPFELPRRRGRPPVRCGPEVNDCFGKNKMQTDTSKTTTERVNAKRSTPKKVNDKKVVVSEETTDNAFANYQESKDEVRALKQTLQKFGWHVRLTKSDADLRLSLTAERGHEILNLVWRGGKLTQHLGGEIIPKA